MKGKIISGPDGRPCEIQLLQINAAFERILGTERSLIIGKNVSELKAVLPSGNYEWFNRWMEDAVKPGYKSTTVDTGPSGTWYEVAVTHDENGLASFYFTNISQTVRRFSDLERFFNLFPDLLCILTEDGRFISVNDSWETSLGYRKNDVEGRNFWDYTHPEETGLNRAFFEKLSSIKRVTNHVNLYRDKDGIYRELEWDAHQDEEKIYAVIRDVTERRKQQKHIEYLNYHDTLTGLFNRQFLEEELKRLDTERNLPFSIIMGDINKLKMINDAFGHEKGDELIRKVSKVLKQCCRLDDLIARWGGDEFMILLPKTNMVESEEIVRRITAGCANEQVNSIAVSIAMGIATKTHAEEDMMDVMRSAEEAMYKNKRLFSKSIRSNIVNIIIHTLYLKDPYEEKHAKRVSGLCRKTARALGMDAEETKKITLSGLLHDIGKIAVDNKILDKPGMLNEIEWKEVRKHAEVGARVIASDPELAEVGDAVLHHHERWDGRGYPKGIRGREIPLMARIIALADGYDAMIGPSVYKKPMTKLQAIDEIRRNKGTQFDPELAEIFITKVLSPK
jgi:diguanylate cyclase (GGDEF)-like protein/PAS domain S-box-containing protein/putative nucleotidyltransferase with HDIG domain